MASATAPQEEERWRSPCGGCLSASLTEQFSALTQIGKGGEGTLLLLKERRKEGLCRGFFPNSYWRATLFGCHGRAVPTLPVLLYTAYTVAVCAVAIVLNLGRDLEQLQQLGGVTTTIGVALFLMLSFRNNAAFSRWQVGSDRFKAFSALAKSTARQITSAMEGFVEAGGRGAHDLMLSKINWLMVAVEMGRQHLRGELDRAKLEGLLEAGEVEAVLFEKDPVLFAIYQAQHLDRRYYAAKCVEWARACDAMYLEFCACTAVYTTPIPYAYIAHLRTFLVLWLACVPWVYVATYGWLTIPLAAAVGYGIIGIEEAAVEVENPFGTDMNDIPLDHIVADTYYTIMTYVKIVRAARDAAAAEGAGARLSPKRAPGGGGRPKGAPGGGGGNGGGDGGARAAPGGAGGREGGGGQSPTADADAAAAGDGDASPRSEGGGARPPPAPAAGAPPPQGGGNGAAAPPRGPRVAAAVKQLRAGDDMV